MKSILCFGDSITYGESDTRSGGWVSRLIQYTLNNSNQTNWLEHSVYNLGIASETSDGLLRRFSSEYKSRENKNCEMTVIFSYGINDIVIHHGKKGIKKPANLNARAKNKVPLEYFSKNLSECIQVASKANAKVIVTSILPFLPKYDGVINQHQEVRVLDDVHRYNLELQEICKLFNTTYLDLFQYFTDRELDLLSTDGLHPNHKGHQLIFEQVLELLNLSKYKDNGLLS